LGGIGWHRAALHWGGIGLGQHGAGVAWGGIALGQHGIGKAWGGIALGRHGVAYWKGMGRHGIATPFGGIPKSANAKLPHLPWQHNMLVKIPNIWNSQGQATLPEFPNLAIPNCPTYTSGTTS